MGTYLTTVGASPGYLGTYVTTVGANRALPRGGLGGRALRCWRQAAKYRRGSHAPRGPPESCPSTLGPTALGVCPPPRMREGARERESVPLVPAAPLWAPTLLLWVLALGTWVPTSLLWVLALGTSGTSMGAALPPRVTAPPLWAPAPLLWALALSWALDPPWGPFWALSLPPWVPTPPWAAALLLWVLARGNWVPTSPLWVLVLGTWVPTSLLWVLALGTSGTSMGAALPPWVPAPPLWAPTSLLWALPWALLAPPPWVLALS